MKTLIEKINTAEQTMEFFAKQSDRMFVAAIGAQQINDTSKSSLLIKQHRVVHYRFLKEYVRYLKLGKGN